MKEKFVFCWSGGKDSALALNRMLQDDRYEIVSLLTTCNEHFQRVSMHGVRMELLDAQAEAIGLPLEKVFVSQRSSNEEYQHLCSFAFAGPIFKRPVRFTVGEKVYRPVEVTHPSDSKATYVCPSEPIRTKGFWFCDLLPA